MNAYELRQIVSRRQATINTDLKSGRIAWKMLEDVALERLPIADLKRIAKQFDYQYALTILEELEYELS